MSVMKISIIYDRKKYTSLHLVPLHESVHVTGLQKEATNIFWFWSY